MTRVERRPRGVSARLMLVLSGLTLVTVAAAAAIAALIGPRIFHANLLAHSDDGQGDATVHAEAAFVTAGSISLAVALSVAIVVATALSLWIGRRLSLSLRPIVVATDRVARGRYDKRVPTPRLGREFEELAAAVNTMSERLQHVDETRRRLLADLAHELRTPLTTLTVYVDSIEDGVRDPDAATLQVLRDQVLRLSRLAEDVSAVSLAQEGRLPLRLQPTSVLEIARAAQAAARPRYEEKEVNLTVEALTSVAEVSGDPVRLGQALSNLLDNALRHSRPHDTVTVRVSASHEVVQLYVIDRGDGIAPEHLAHIFDRFYRIDTARDRDNGGSGIGLSVSRALIEAHQGSLEATSAGLGQGAQFYITLPRFAPQRASRPRHENS